MRNGSHNSRGKIGVDRGRCNRMTGQQDNRKGGEIDREALSNADLVLIDAEVQMKGVESTGPGSLVCVEGPMTVDVILAQALLTGDDVMLTDANVLLTAAEAMLFADPLTDMETMLTNAEVVLTGAEVYEMVDTAALRCSKTCYCGGSEGVLSAGGGM
ncbi:hypothetical protein E2C01_024953 [Portunus trituberculatus]|uniref:Uncharacterized protein n=1 Tax=Portunus trituberculatus TaxID=210409 RepID=A0A5B7EEA6_PORTR|nr:hypothetical protein [Portunus trituberculatus]